VLFLGKTEDTKITYFAVEHELSSGTELQSKYKLKKRNRCRDGGVRWQKDIV
jgi:hypothetical protein